MYFFKKTSKFIVILLTVILFFSPILEVQAKPNKEGKTGKQEKIENNMSYIVSLKSGVNSDQFIMKKGLHSKKIKNLKKIEGLAMELSHKELELLQSSAEVEYIEPDSQMTITSQGKADKQHKDNKKIKDGSDTIPWGLTSIGVEQALQINEDGKHVKIAVLDTGVASHDDLKIAGGTNFVEATPLFNDDNGHGTHVIGTIAAQRNNEGIVGVASDAQLYAIKVLDGQGSGSYSQVIQGIEWSIENKMDIISMSFGGTKNSRALHEAIQKAEEAGILVIAAAGNRGAGEETELYPALFPEVISVGAVTKSHGLAAYSSTGKEIDVVAPGSEILSTTIDGKYGVMSGTSMAAPHVTGAAAVIWSENKKWSNIEVKSKLYESATYLGSAHEYGHGLINLAKALGLTELALPPYESSKDGELNPPAAEDPSYLELQTFDANILEWSQQLYQLFEEAEASGDQQLAKEILQKYHELLSQNTTLHQSEEPILKTEGQTMVSANYDAKANDFTQLEALYKQAVLDYTTIMNTDSLIDSQGDVSSTSYDRTGDGQTIMASNSARVSLKLEGYRDNNPHEKIDISVYPSNNPSNVVASYTINNPSLNTTIAYTWYTSRYTSAGTYTIKFHYPAALDHPDTFTIYVTPYVSEPTPPSDSYEYNNSFNYATYISTGRSYSAYIYSQGDEDYFRFSPSTSGKISIKLVVPSDKDYDIRVYNSAQSQIDSSAAGTGSTEYINDLSVTAGQTYYIRVYGYNNAYGYSSYSLSLSNITAPANPPTQPTGLTTTSVTENSVTLNWNAVSGATKYYLQKNGSSVTTTTSTSYTFTGLASNTAYTLGVAANNSNGTSSYATKTATTSTTDTFEPNNSTSSAKVVSLGSSYNSYIASATDVDYYKFTPSSTGMLKVRLDVPTDKDYDIDILDSSGRAFEWGDAGLGDAEEVLPFVTANNTYYLKVYGYQQAFGTNPYTLSLVNIMPDTDESNDTMATATSISVGGAKTSYISKPDDIDYFKFVASSTGNINIKLNVPSNADYDLTLLDSGAGFIREGANTGSEDITEAVTAGSTYYIKVFGYAGAYSSTSYTLSIGNVNSIPSAPSGLNATASENSMTLTWNAISNASSYKVTKNGVVVGTTTNTSYTISGLTANTSYTLGVAAVNSYGTSAYSTITKSTSSPVVPVISLNAPIDVSLPIGSSKVYKFTPSTTGDYRIFTGPYGGFGSVNDTVLDLYDNAALTNLKDSNDDISSDIRYSQIVHQLTAGQTYYIKIYPYSSDQAIHARLTVERDASNTITTASLGTPLDVDVPQNGQKVFKFTPTTTGKYDIFTGYYGGTSSSGMSDTILSGYTDVNLSSLIGQPNNPNDDIDTAAGNYFSKLSLNLTAGTSYYFKLVGYGNGAVHARFKIAQSTVEIATIGKNSPQDVSLNAGENGYYKFTPSASGVHRIFTSPYGGTSTMNDTILTIYSDPQFTQGITGGYNDDSNGPFGAQFSKVEFNMTAGTTYYIKLSPKGTSSLYTRLTVEDDFDSIRANAKPADWNQIYTGDITSPYDIDYYRVEVTELNQIHLNVTVNLVKLEDSSGNVLATFMPGDKTVFKPQTTGSYYARVEYDSAQGTALSEIDVQATNYYVSAKTTIVNKTEFDASNGVPDPANIRFFYYDEHAFTKVEIGRVEYAGPIRYVTKVYETTLGNKSGGSFHSYVWDGRVDKDKGLPRNSSNDFARDGEYVITIVPTDAPGSSHPALGSITVKSGPSEKIRVKGFVKPNLKPSHFSSDVAIPTPLEGFNVQIWDDDGGFNSPDRLDDGTVFTDANGYFEVIVDNDLGEDGIDPYVVLEINDKYARIYSYTLIRWQSNTKNNIQTAEVDFGTLQPEHAGAFSIWKWIKEGHDYYKVNSFDHFDMPQVLISWNPGMNNGTNVEGSPPYVMNIDGKEEDGNHWNGDTILHEYGHFIMNHVAGGGPENDGGSHNMVDPSRPGTAYSEAWAHFFSLAVRNSELKINRRDPYGYGGDFEKPEYYYIKYPSGSGKEDETGPVSEGRNYELSIGAVLWDLFDDGVSTGESESFDKLTYLFKYVDLAMRAENSSDLPYNQDITDLYLRWFELGYADGKEYDTWKLFDLEKVSNDIHLPENVTLTRKSDYEYCVSATDDIGIKKIEWYIYGYDAGPYITTHYDKSYTCLDFSGLDLPDGSYTIGVKVFDHQGYKGEYLDFGFNKDLTDDKVYRSAYTSGFINLEINKMTSLGDVNFTQISEPETYVEQHNPRNINELSQKLQDNIPTNVYLIDSKTSLLQGTELEQIKFVTDGGNDLNIYGVVAGPMDQINVYDPEGNLIISQDQNQFDEKIHIENALPGIWTVAITPYQDVETIIPYSVVMTSNPSFPSLSFPELVNSKTLSLNAVMDVDHEIEILVNGIAQVTTVTQSVYESELQLQEGMNHVQINVYDGKSNSVQSFVIDSDTIAPEITLNMEENLTTTEEYIHIHGELSTDVESLYINDQQIGFGEFIPFFGKVFILDEGDNIFTIKALDIAGNISTKIVNIRKE